MADETGKNMSNLRVLICTPFMLDEPKGNSVAARRLKTGLLELNAAVEVLDWPAIDKPERIRQMALQFRPDVVLLLHAWRCATAAATLRIVIDAPQVTSMRGTDLNEMLDDPATIDTLESVLDASSAIVVFRRATAEQLIAHKSAWGAKTVIIPNGVQLSSSGVCYRRRLGIPQDAFVFGAVCGLREVKRPLLVLPWICQLRKQYRNLVWMHTGLPLEDEVVGRLQAFSAEHEWVYHIDQVPHCEIDSFLRAADVFVAASRSEGMPHAVREAMLAGRPCLMSDIEGHRALAAANQEALFFGNQTEFTGAAHTLIGRPDVCASLGQAARIRIQTELALYDEARLYFQLFATLRCGKNIHGISREIA